MVIGVYKKKCELARVSHGRAGVKKCTRYRVSR